MAITFWNTHVYEITRRKYHLMPSKTYRCLGDSHYFFRVLQLTFM